MNYLKINGKRIRIRCNVNRCDCMLQSDAEKGSCTARNDDLIKRGCFTRFIGGRQFD